MGAAGLALGFGFQIHALPLLGHLISSPLLSIPLTLLWVLLVTNAFNLIDGLDGLSGGLAFIAGLTLPALSLVRGDVQTALLALSASLSASVMVIDFLLFSFLTAAARASFRLLEYVKFKGEERERRVLIYGAGRGGGLTLRECLQNRQLGLKPVGFVDDDPGKRRKNFNACPVLGAGEDIPDLVDEHRIDTVLISSPEIPSERVAWLREVLEEKGVELQRCRIVLKTLNGHGGGEGGWDREDGAVSPAGLRAGVGRSDHGESERGGGI